MSAVRWAERLFAPSLRGYPEFRAACGAEMRACFRDGWRAALASALPPLRAKRVDPIGTCGAE